MTDNPTVRAVLAQFPTIPDDVRGQVEAALIEREDLMADQLRMAGMQLGAMPEFVAEVIADIGLGTVPDTETRALIHSQFHQRLEWLQEQFRQQGGGS